VGEERNEREDREVARERASEKACEQQNERARERGTTRAWRQRRQLLGRNVKRFRGGLVFKAHRLLYPSTLHSRVIRRRRKGDLVSVEGKAGISPARFGRGKAVQHRDLSLIKNRNPP
jgi:hypothetical protein